MNRFLIIFFVLTATAGFLRAQTTIALTFTASVNSVHYPLDSINIKNITKGGDTTLFGNDTILLLDHGIGTFNNNADYGNQMILFSPYPNPVSSNSIFKIYIPNNDIVSISIYDINGKKISSFSQRLPRGINEFEYHPGGETIALVVAEAGGKRMIQKIINLNRQGSGPRVDCIGYQTIGSQYRKGIQSLAWAPGDSLIFTGYTGLGNDTLVDNPSTSTLYTFQIIPPVPLPNADFTTSDTIVQTGDTVYFSDLSTGTTTS